MNVFLLGPDCGVWLPCLPSSGELVGDPVTTLHESSYAHNMHTMSICPNDEPGVVVKYLGVTLPKLETIYPI